MALINTPKNDKQIRKNNMKISLLFTTRSLTTTNIDMTKKYKITIFQNNYIKRN